MPSLAFAATNTYGFTKIIYGPVSYKWDDVTYYQYGVAAYSKFDAAAVTIGFDPDTFTEEQKAKLSNESTGGAFWTYAQLFDNPNPDGVSVTMQGVSPGFWATAYGIYGEGNVWYAEVTGDQRIAAQIDLRVVLAGGDLGGSGSDGVDEYSTLPEELQLTNMVGTPIGYNGVMPPKLLLQNVSNCSVASSYRYCTGLFFQQASSMTSSNPARDSKKYVFLSNSPMVFVIPLGVEGAVATASTQDGTPFVYYSATGGFNDVAGEQVSGSLNVSGSGNLASDGQITFSNRYRYHTYYATNTTNVNGDTGTGGGGGNEWPDSPQYGTPDPPTVDPPTTPTEPTNPTSPTPPTYPPDVNYPDVTYTDADISAVLDAMNEHCEHITSAVYNAGASLYSSLSSYLVSEFSATRGLMRSLSVWEIEAIGGYLDAMFGYFDDLTEWLDSRLKFDAIVDILMRIYGNLPSMDATEGYLEDILSSLTNMQDEDTNVPLIRGYLKGIFEDLEALVMPDLTALEHQLQDTAEQDGVTLTIRGLLQSMDLGIKDIDAILSDWTYPTTNDYSEVLSNIYDEIAAYTDTFTQFWADLQEYLDAVLYDLEHLEVNERNNWPEHGTPQLPDLDEETGIVPWEDVLNLTALRDAVTRLMDKFPFSTINNFIRILNWFVRPARAPVFDLPLPNPSDWSDPYMVNVDLSIWDTPAAVLRMGITIWASARMSRRTVAMWTREEGGGDA